MKNVASLPDGYFLPHDAEEEMLMQAIESENFVPQVHPQKKEIEQKLQEALAYTAQKTFPISIRLRKPTFLKMKEKARQTGIPYQSLLSALADQYIEGKITLQV
ncbi:MAG: hypothetical protein WCJ84_04995 [Candidatus Peregrinibacteria bacterium]